ncbi:hypothetical protein DENSPDRAFT_68668 [Dentipellis sp. KUC8613]|nr:hypothetical protein DENSPDRAFT_68668 [Dentipellis sp. KUC8613]
MTARSTTLRGSYLAGGGASSLHSSHPAASGLGPPPGLFQTLATHLNPASLPSIESDSATLSVALGQAETCVSTLSAPSLLKTASSSTEGSDSGTSSDLLHTAGDVLSNILERIERIGDVFAEVHPYAKLAWVVLSSGYKILKAQVDRDDRVRNLWCTVQDVVAFFDDVKEQPAKATYLQKVVADVVKQIYECCQFLRKYADHGFAGRTFRNTLSLHKDDALQLLIDSFQTLKEQLSRGVSLDNWKCLRALGDDLGEMKDQIQELWLYTLIEGQATIVECDTTRGCLPGTRTKMINDITGWIHDTSRGRVLWLSGPVGTGKSSVANSIAGLLKGMGRLGASYRFDKQVDPSAFFRQIAYQLARIDKSVKDTMLSVLTQRGDIASAALPDQAMRIVVRPLHTVDLVGPVVIVIDALDEIRHRDSRIRDDILAFFSNKDFALPDYVKILITSRDNPHVRLHLQTRGGYETLSIDDYDDTPADICLFVRRRLSEIKTLAGIARGWPPVGADRKLAERAGRQFQWASITCQFIAESPRSRLALVLSSNAITHDGTRQLDALYNSIIQSAYEARGSDRSYVSEFRYVVGCITAGKIPFRTDDLNSLLDLEDDCYSQVQLPDRKSFYMEGAAQLLSSVRPLFSSTTTTHGRPGPLHLVHTSLFEFLTDSDRCANFYIDLSYWNLVLAIQCVKTLNVELDVEDSTGQSRQSNILTARPVSGALRYACQFFARHISELENRQHYMLMSQMNLFLSKRLFRWIELMLSLGFEWMESLNILTASYDMPAEYELIAKTTTAEEKIAVIASIVGEGVKHLIDTSLIADEEGKKAKRYHLDLEAEVDSASDEETGIEGRDESVRTIVPSTSFDTTFTKESTDDSSASRVPLRPSRPALSSDMDSPMPMRIGRVYFATYHHSPTNSDTYPEDDRRSEANVGRRGQEAREKPVQDAQEQPAVVSGSTFPDFRQTLIDHRKLYILNFHEESLVCLPGLYCLFILQTCGVHLRPRWRMHGYPLPIGELTRLLKTHSSMRMHS